MRKFLLEDGEASSYPRPKRQRPSSPSSSPPPPEFPMEEIAREEEDSDDDEEEDDDDDEEEEDDDDDEDTSDESEEEDEEEVEEIVRPLPRPPQLQNNQMETVGLQLLQPRLYESPIFLEPTLVRPGINGAIFVALSDPEVLDCPTCCETLTIPVFQCENGHVACSSCSKKLQHKCPSCAMPIGDNRCRAIEKVLESLKVQCSNWRYGCRENICFSKKYEHDKCCSHALCTCPLLGCNFQGSSKQLYLHCRRKHLGKLTSFQFNTSFPLFITVNDKFCILQEDKEGVLFILNNRWDTLGHVITISCMGLSSSKPGYFYELMTRAGGSNIRFQSSTRNVQTRVDDPPSLGCLLVPNDFLGAYGQITLDVCIWHLGSYPAISSV